LALEALLAAKIELDYLEQIEQEQWRRRSNGYVASCLNLGDAVAWWEGSSEYATICHKWKQVRFEAASEH
jgi:hypothetical protein